MKRTALPVLVALLAPALLSAATFAVQADDTGRFSLEKSADGFVRMDTRTGAISVCSESSGQIVCKPAADERSAFHDELERLQGKITALEGRIAALESSIVHKPEAMLPSEEEFERSLGYMERFFRKFLGVMKEFDGEDSEPRAQDGQPQKT